MKTTTLIARLHLLTPGGVTAPEATRAVERRDRDGTTSTRNLLPLRRDPAGTVVVSAAQVHPRPRWRGSTASISRKTVSGVATALNRISNLPRLTRSQMLTTRTL